MISTHFKGLKYYFGEDLSALCGIVLHNEWDWNEGEKQHHRFVQYN